MSQQFRILWSQKWTHEHMITEQLCRLILGNSDWDCLIFLISSKSQYAKLLESYISQKSAGLVILISGPLFQ